MRMDSYDFKEIELGLCEFRNISAFFSRPICSSARPVGSNNIISPCDGTILEGGKIINESIISVKGIDYNLLKLTGDKLICSKFTSGSFVNIYLSPKNYHRFHIPCDGKINYVRHIPGCCLPVNKFGRKEPKIYSINERYIVNITNQNMDVCMVIVGAAAVTGITLFKIAGEKVKKGELLGMFELGSSIVLLTNSNLGDIKTNIQTKACSNL